MTSFRKLPPAPFVAMAAILVAAAPLYFAAHQAQKSRRFEIGTLDYDFLARAEEFHRPSVMSGPIRYEDGSVEVLEFYGRVSRRRAELRLPYHAKGSPLRLFIRSHRFGLEGTVALSVNGEKLGDFIFGETSYPWGGIRTVVPQEVAERGPLHIDLLTEGGKPPPSHLPEDTGLGIDWIDVEPMSDGATVQPGLASYASLYGFALGAFLFTLLTGASLSRGTWVLAGIIILACGMTVLYPVATAMALSRLLVVFPLAALLYLVLRFLGDRLSIPGTSRTDLGFACRLFAVSAIAHSTLLFFPNHLPPDIPQHAMQLALLSEHDFSYRSLRDYSQRIGRTINEDMVVIDDPSVESSAGSESRESRVRTFRAPYPPFYFLLAYGGTRLYDDPQFVLEFSAVLMAALMLVLVFLIGRSIWQESTIARLAAALFALEISVWHHVGRGHSPGVFGALFVLFYLWIAVAFPSALDRTRGLIVFALITMGVALCYTVALIQVSIFTALFVASLVLFTPDPRWRQPFRLSMAFAVGVSIAVALFYGPYLVEAVTPSQQGGVLFDRAGAFDPPASYYFLRNHLRDTVRIYQNGYTLYVLLSLVGLALLGGSGASRYHRRLLWAAFASYVAMLVLKDPLFLPRVFLHTKEDLFYSPIACLLAAPPIAGLCRRPWGRAVAVFLFLGLLGLTLRDKAWSTNTTRSQPLALAFDESRVRTLD